VGVLGRVDEHNGGHKVGVHIKVTEYFRLYDEKENKIREDELTWQVVLIQE